MKRQPALLAALGLIVLAGLGLRLFYLLHAAPWTDEYYTQLAVQMVAKTGTPVLPSGLFYTHGLPHTYAAALLAWLFGLSRTIARLPSLLFSLPSILLLFHVGRRWYGPRAGLLAALMLALAPEAIAWGGQARMYVMWQFFTLAAVYSLYEGFVRPGTRGHRVWGLLALGGAILCQVRTLLTIPPLFLGLMSARWLSRRQGFDVWHLNRKLAAELTSLSVVLASAALLFCLDRPIGVIEAGQLPVTNWLNPARLFADLLIGSMQFLISPYIILTVVALGGGLWLVLRLLRGNPQPGDTALLLIAITSLGVIVEFSLVSPVIVRVPRYIFDILPFYFLVVARELDFVAGEIASRWRGPLAALVGWLPLILLLGLFAAPALTAARSQPSAVQPAMEYVRAHLQHGDRIAARLPALPYLELGRCDYFVALQDPFVWETAQGTVDPHLGLPWIGTTEGVQRIVDESRRLWIIVEARFADAYRPILGDRLTTAFRMSDYVVYLVEGRP